MGGYNTPDNGRDRSVKLMNNKPNTVLGSVIPVFLEHVAKRTTVSYLGFPYGIPSTVSAMSHMRFCRATLTRDSDAGQSRRCDMALNILGMRPSCSSELQSPWSTERIEDGASCVCRGSTWSCSEPAT